MYVQPFPVASGGKWKIGSGSQPRWRRDGRELFYISPDSKVMAVDVTTTPAFKAGTPEPLFTAPTWAGARFVSRYDVTADGKKFLITILPGENPVVTTPITGGTELGNGTEEAMSGQAQQSLYAKHRCAVRTAGS